jgi:GH15 family glucan-1,4-alpha-glucosidase
VTRAAPARARRQPTTPYPPIGDYALIGDCHSAALISRAGSIDWCCLPRFDSGSCFGRLLDWARGGHCSVRLKGSRATPERAYLEGTLVLETTFRGPDGEVRVLDFFAMRAGGRENPRREIVRIVEGIAGRPTVKIEVAVRFDYAEMRPWLRRVAERGFAAIGGNDGLLISSDADLEPNGNHDLVASVAVAAGERVRLSIQYARPEDLDGSPPRLPEPEDLDRRLDETVGWWHRWSREGRHEGRDDPGVRRSALVLKALTHAPTGALVAAPTTSLPEVEGGSRNWDYRMSWIRDSSLAARALSAIGHDGEADGFRRFVERSAAGSAEELQIMFGVGGERRLVEIPVASMEGYRRSAPVRVGNAASEQRQWDVFGELLGLAWRWHLRGHSPDDDYWRFLVELVEAAARFWAEPDRGIWEVRSRPSHFVYSKAMCWSAVNRGIRLSKACERTAPVRRWSRVRDEIKAAIERDGYERKRGVFVRSFGSRAMDAALLLLPLTGLVEYGDERMVRTVDCIREELEDGGLLRRYPGSDGLAGREGAFLPASFWLAECLARQSRTQEATEVYDNAVAAANDLGLFSEEFDPRRGQMLGNFPLGLTHLSHVLAAVALSPRRGDERDDGEYGR